MSQAETSRFPESQMVQLVDADGKNTELEVFMAGAGRPVVLCHGWPEHAYSWRHQIQPLVDAGYQVIVPNQRGYGRSPRPEAVEDYDIVHLTGDLIGLLDSLGIENALFAGHDWGAMVGWQVVRLHPQRVLSWTALSIPHPLAVADALAAYAAEVLSRPSVAYVDVRSARNNCFQTRITASP